MNKNILPWIALGLSVIALAIAVTFLITGQGEQAGTAAGGSQTQLLVATGTCVTGDEAFESSPEECENSNGDRWCPLSVEDPINNPDESCIFYVQLPDGETILPVP